MPRFRYILLIIFITLLSAPARAQERVDTIAADSLALLSVDASEPLPHEPVLSIPSPMPYAHSFGAYLSPYMWSLHEGFNAMFSLNVAVGLGKHSPHGVGFGESVAFAYLHPISERLYFAGGLTAHHTTWGGRTMTALQIGALLGYRVSERLDLYAYATKNLLSNRQQAYSPYLWERPAKDRIGLGMEYKVSPAFSVGLNLEHARYEGFNPYYAPHIGGIRPYDGLDW